MSTKPYRGYASICSRAVYRCLRDDDRQQPSDCGRGWPAQLMQGSAFCMYFMYHLPVDWHNIAGHPDFEADLAMRRPLIERGIFN
jgi:hypothetical protein